MEIEWTSADVRMARSKGLSLIDGFQVDTFSIVRPRSASAAKVEHVLRAAIMGPLNLYNSGASVRTEPSHHPAHLDTLLAHLVSTMKNSKLITERTKKIRRRVRARCIRPATRLRRCWKRVKGNGCGPEARVE